MVSTLTVAWSVSRIHVTDADVAIHNNNVKCTISENRAEQASNPWTGHTPKLTVPITILQYRTSFL